MTQEAAVPAGFLEQMRRVAREEAAAAFRSAALRNATISEGGTLTIKGGRLRVQYPAAKGGGDGVFFGNIYNEDDATEYIGTGLLIEGPNGEDIAQFRSDESSGGNLVSLRDQVGNVTHTTFGAPDGLNRPYFHGGFTPERFADFGAATTSATFETLYRANCYRQHPEMFVRTRASAEVSDTAGELRVLVNGGQLGAAQSVGFAVSTFDFGSAPVGAAHMEWLTIEIQARRTAGTGAVRVAPGLWIGLA